MPVACLNAGLAQSEHQICPIDSSAVPEAMPSRQPHQRHPIGRGKSAAVVDLVQLRAFLTLHYRMNGPDIHIITSPLANPTGDFVDRLLEVACMNADTQD